MSDRYIQCFLIMKIKIERPHKSSEYFVIITFNAGISSLKYQQQHLVHSRNTLVYLLFLILSYIPRNAFNDIFCYIIHKVSIEYCRSRFGCYDVIDHGAHSATVRYTEGYNRLQLIVYKKECDFYKSIVDIV